MSEKQDAKDLERELKHAARKAKFGTDRQARKEALDERQKQAEDIGNDARGFAHAVALRRSVNNNADTAPKQTVQSTTSTITGNQLPPTPSDAGGKNFNGIPLDFYCFMKGKISVVKIYCEADPFQI